MLINTPFVVAMWKPLRQNENLPRMPGFAGFPMAEPIISPGFWFGFIRLYRVRF
jgi:hypothetical protein